jgi:hypothetical protein
MSLAKKYKELNEKTFGPTGIKDVHKRICSTLADEDGSRPFYFCRNENDLKFCDYLDEHWRQRTFDNQHLRRSDDDDDDDDDGESIFQYAKTKIMEHMVSELLDAQTRMQEEQIGFFVGPIVSYKFYQQTDTHRWTYKWKMGLADIRDPLSQKLIESHNKHLKK